MSYTKLFIKEARESITGEWDISLLSDGKITGSGYKYEVSYGSYYSEVGNKLIIKGIQNKI